MAIENITPADFLKRLVARYGMALHAVQTGVAMHVVKNHPSIEPKHLRVGVNSALIDSATLAELLIERGIFTREEYLTKLCLKAEEEVSRYEKELGVKLL